MMVYRKNTNVLNISSSLKRAIRETSNRENEPNSKLTLHRYRVKAIAKRNDILPVWCEQFKP